MRISYVIIIFLFVTSCNNKNSKHQTIVNTGEQGVESIDFLDKKYQANGFCVADQLSGNLYPSYSYFDNNIGAFSVNFIGKDREEQKFWSVYNKNGYFSQQGDDTTLAYDSDKIQKILDSRREKYDIIVHFLDKKYIKNYDETTGEFDVDEEAIVSFYLYENGRWKHLRDEKNVDIPDDTFAYYLKLISNEKSSTIDKNRIIKTLENQKLLENEETEDEYVLSQNDLDVLSDIVSIELKNKGYQPITEEDFVNRINTLFSVDLRCDDYEMLGSRYTVFHGNMLDGNSQTLRENLYEPYSETRNLFIDKKNQLVINFSLLKEMVSVNNQEVVLSIPHFIIARNKYLFNNSKADYEWLKSNDSIFLCELVTTFGYIDDEDLTLFAMNQSSSNAEAFGKLLYNKKCNDTYRFNKKVFDLISKCDKEKQIQYLRLISEYLVNKVNSDKSLSSQEIEMLGKTAYYSTKIGESNHMYYDFFSTLGAIDGGLEYEKEFRKKNYYGISDFKNIWEETKAGGVSYQNGKE